MKPSEIVANAVIDEVVKYLNDYSGHKASYEPKSVFGYAQIRLEQPAVLPDLRFRIDTLQLDCQTLICVNGVVMMPNAELIARYILGQ